MLPKNVRATSFNFHCHKGSTPKEFLKQLDPGKDADGLHPFNLGRLVLGYEAPLPCTPRAIVALLDHYKISTQGADITVIGRGLTVGRPLGLLLTQ